MSDIQLRFNRDMLVLSAPVQAALARLGADVSKDTNYMLLFEPEVIEEAYKMELLADPACIVLDTAGLTRAQLAQSNMVDDAHALMKSAVDIARQFNPQHLLAELAPSGLPLDPASKDSLIENRDQYSSFAKLVKDQSGSVDAIFLNGFDRIADAKCALMGIRKVSDIPLFVSFPVNAKGELAIGCDVLQGGMVWNDDVASKDTETIEAAVLAAEELGADVIGVSLLFDMDAAKEIVARIKAVSDLPILIQLFVNRVDYSDSDPDAATIADDIFDAAEVLRGAGVQFLRVIGDPTPSCTGALVAATEDLDVVVAPKVDEPHFVFDEDPKDLASRLKAKIDAALDGESQ